MKLQLFVVLLVGIIVQAGAYPSFYQNFEQDEPTYIYVPSGEPRVRVLPYPLLVTPEGYFIDEDGIIVDSMEEYDDLVEDSDDELSIEENDDEFSIEENDDEFSIEENDDTLSIEENDDKLSIEENDTNDVDDDDVSNESDEVQINHRTKRQLGDFAAHLASTHNDFNLDGVSKPRPVGKIYPAAHYVKGQTGPVKHWNAGIGASSVLWRSDNKKHSIGAGVYGAMGGAKVHGFKFQSKPQYGAGLGYTFSFGK